jgi:hypothetical protein
MAGIFAWGLVAGMAMMQSGLTLWQALGMTSAASLGRRLCRHAGPLGGDDSAGGQCGGAGRRDRGRRGGGGHDHGLSYKLGLLLALLAGIGAILFFLATSHLLDTIVAGMALFTALRLFL